MKNIVKALFVAVLLAGCFSCKDDSGDNPVFGPNEVYFYDNKPATLAVNLNEQTIVEMLVSPNNGTVQCRWLLDGVQIGTERNLTYTFTQKGTFKLRFEASRGTRTISKEFQLTVN